MAIKTMYRGLNTDDGKIRLYEYEFYSNVITLDKIEVEYDDELKEEHREKLIESIEKNIKDKEAKHLAEMFKLKTIRDQLLQLENKSGEVVEGEFIPAEPEYVAGKAPVDFDDDIPF